jgi:hypothetical protein
MSDDKTPTPGRFGGKVSRREIDELIRWIAHVRSRVIVAIGDADSIDYLEKEKRCKDVIMSAMKLNNILEEVRRSCQR